MLKYTALVTLLSVALYFFLGTRVAVARRTFGVKLPATSGNDGFDRVYRAHMNTLEWAPIYFPSLWLCAAFFSDFVAAGLGLIWVGGRYLYYVGYAEAVEKRIPGFAVQVMAVACLIIGALFGIIRSW